ncbi:MAG: DNA polymerase III subunit gamma/tau [Gemmatimonadota bacterium]
MALALARRYRPRRFSDLLVQDHVAAVLRGAVAKHRVGHGYLLTGPRGVGKTTAARILAMALNCERPDPANPGEPCGECETCQRIWSGSANLDVVEIDAASNRGVDDARDLRERAMYAASRADHHKVYIVDEAHMLTREAWNALLKILEEPPPGVVFVFATTEPQKIAAAAAPVMSRLQRFDFRRIGPGAIRERLRQVLDLERIEADDDALTLIARQANGGMRDALSVLDQCLSFGEGAITVDRVRDVLGLIDDEVYGELLALVAERDPARVFPLVDRLMDAGEDLVEFMNGAGETLRALLMLELGAEPDELTDARRRAVEARRGQIPAGDLLRMLKLLAEAEPGIRRGASPRLVVETLLLRWAMLDRTVDLAQVLAGGPAPESAPAPRRPAADAGAEPGPSSSGRSAPPPSPRRSSAPAPEEPGPAPVPGAAVPPAGAEPGSVTFTLDGLRAAWPAVVSAAKGQSPFLAQALASATPVEVGPPWLTLGLEPAAAGFAEDALERQREAAEGLIGRLVGAPVRLRIQPPVAEAPAKPKRLSEAAAKSDRLKSMRAKDPALDTAATELDLEIVD